MANDEASLLDEMANDFREATPLGFWRKIHGSRFQAGIADVLAGTDYGCSLTEFKWAKTQAECDRPLGVLALDKLSDLQRVELASVNILDGPLRGRLVIGTPVQVEEYDAGVLAVGGELGDFLRVQTHSLADFARAVFYAKAMQDYSLRNELPSGFEYQLRARGETWRSGPIVVGMRTHERVEV